VPRERTIEQIGRSLNELARFGANLGQQIRLEVHGRQTSELPVIKAIMDVADHPGVGVCWNSNGVDLRGAGLEHNFSLVKDRLGATAHVRELSDTRYPYQRLMNLFVAMDYAGWVLLEASTKPRDRVQALGTQRALWEKMVATARKTVRSRRR
jgi:sugar phosphate isomerase/epimerase